jgi:hypothetical protein
LYVSQSRNEFTGVVVRRKGGGGRGSSGSPVPRLKVGSEGNGTTKTADRKRGHEVDKTDFKDKGSYDDEEKKIQVDDNQIVLTRPVPVHPVRYRRIKTDFTASGSSSSRSGAGPGGLLSTTTGFDNEAGVYRGSVLSNTASRSVVGYTLSLMSGDGGRIFGGSQVFGASSMHSDLTGFGSGLGGDETLLLPRAPTIPFIRMTNSLQLCLKFKIFSSGMKLRKLLYILFAKFSKYY